MSSVALIIAILVLGTVFGFFGLAVASSAVGQLSLMALAGAIVTYWTMLASNKPFA